MIEDGVTGRLVPPGDAMALAETLESFHGRPDAALRMGRSGEERVLERFAWDRVLDSFELIYDDVLGLASFESGGPRAGGTRAERRSGSGSRSAEARC